MMLNNSTPAGKPHETGIVTQDGRLKVTLKKSQGEVVVAMSGPSAPRDPRASDVAADAADAPAAAAAGAADDASAAGALGSSLHRPRAAAGTTAARGGYRAADAPWRGHQRLGGLAGGHGGGAFTRRTRSDGDGARAPRGGARRVASDARACSDVPRTTNGGSGSREARKPTRGGAGGGAGGGAARAALVVTECSAAPARPAAAVIRRPFGGA